MMAEVPVWFGSDSRSDTPPCLSSGDPSTASTAAPRAARDRPLLPAVARATAQAATIRYVSAETT